MFCQPLYVHVSLLQDLLHNVLCSEKVIHGKNHKKKKGVIHELATAFSDSQPSSLFRSHFLVMRPLWCRTKRSRDLKSMSHWLLRVIKYLTFNIKHHRGMNFFKGSYEKTKFCTQGQKSMRLYQQRTLFSELLCSFVVLLLNVEAVLLDFRMKNKDFWHFTTLIIYKMQSRRFAVKRATPRERPYVCPGEKKSRSFSWGNVISLLRTWHRTERTRRTTLKYRPRLEEQVIRPS